jgi:hypothetical protein
MTSTHDKSNPTTTSRSRRATEPKVGGSNPLGRASPVPLLRKKRQVLRTRRPSGLDAATLTSGTCLVNGTCLVERPTAGGESGAAACREDCPQSVAAGATSKLNIIPLSWCSAMWFAAYAEAGATWLVLGTIGDGWHVQ